MLSISPVLSEGANYFLHHSRFRSKLRNIYEVAEDEGYAMYVCTVLWGRESSEAKREELLT